MRGKGGRAGVRGQVELQADKSKAKHPTVRNKLNCKVFIFYCYIARQIYHYVHSPSFTTSASREGWEGWGGEQAAGRLPKVQMCN